MKHATRQVTIPNLQGLHARPIAQISRLANEYESRLLIDMEGLVVNGRSVLELMTLCAPRGSALLLKAEGEDAEELVDRVAALIEAGFGEEC
ncbi:MAG: HPr family phosphocarrier protein [Planctomycetota bacterium]